MNRVAAPRGLPSHLPALDGLRGLAILGVLLFHFWIPSAPASLPARLWHYLTVAGWCGVDLFFVLSGFLITGILFDTKQTAHYFRNFYMRRTLRIFPLYYGFLFFIFVLLPRLPVALGAYHTLRAHQLWLWTYLQNFCLVFRLDVLPCGMNHFWSLAIEEQFYLVWPLVVFRSTRQQLLRVAAGLIGVALVFRFAAARWGLAPEVLYVLPFARMDGFAAGAFVALALRGEESRQYVVRGARVVVGAGLAFLLAVAWWHHGYFVFIHHAVKTAGFTVLALTFASLLALAVTSPPGGLLRRFLGLAPLRWLGQYSYGLYVFHFPILYALLVWQAPLAVWLERWAGSRIVVLTRSPFWVPSLASVLSLTAAYLSWHAYEKHFLKLKRLFPHEPAAGPVAVPVPRKAAA